jgi:hypothetical protein
MLTEPDAHELTPIAKEPGALVLRCRAERAPTRKADRCVRPGPGDVHWHPHRSHTLTRRGVVGAAGRTLTRRRVFEYTVVSAAWTTRKEIRRRNGWLKLSCD